MAFVPGGAGMRVAPRSRVWKQTDLFRISPLAGQIPGRNGAVDYTGPLLNKLSRYGIEPMYANDFRSQLDRAKRQINHLDMRQRFDGQAVVFDASLNDLFEPSANAILNTYVCPRFPVKDLNFHITDWDAYLAPFDETTTLNIPNVTHHETSSQTYTLTYFTRAAEFELNLLLSEFGPLTWDRAMLTLLKQFEYTELVCTADAIILAPTQRRRMYYNAGHVLDHNREIKRQRDRLFCATGGTKKLMNLVNQDILEAPRVVLLASTNLTKFLDTMDGGPANVPYYFPYFDNEAQAMIMGSHEIGNQTTKTVSLSNGTLLDVITFRPLKPLKTSTEEEAFNPFRGQVVLGEVIQQAPFSVEHLSHSEATISTKMLDVGAASQTQHSIENKRIGYLDNLQFNILFLNKDGTVNKDGLGDYYTDLAHAYNEDAQNFYDAFRLVENSDNNKPATRYLVGNEAPSTMLGFRHYDGFLCYNDAAEKDQPPIQKPEYWGDVEIKTLPAKDVFLRAQMLLHLHTTEFKATNGRTPTAAEYFSFLKNLLPGHPLAKIQKDPTDEDVVRWMTYVTERVDTDPIPREQTFTLGTPNFGLARDSPVRPLANETRAAYEARVGNADTLKDLVTGKAFEKSTWASILMHVPDSAVQSLSTILHVSLQTPEVSAADTQALKQLSEEVSKHSNRAHVTEMLDNISGLLKKDPKATIASVMASLTDNGRPLLTPQQEQRLNANTVAQSKILSSAVKLGAGVFGYDGIGSTDKGRKNYVSRTQRHSWKHHNEYLNLHLADSILLRFTYVFLLNTRVNYKTTYALGRYGISFFQTEYLRLFMRFDTEGAYMVIPGPDTMILAIMQPNARLSTAGVEGSATIVAATHMGVVVKDNKNFHDYPNAICRRYINGRNLNPIRTQADIPTNAPNDYDSVIVVPRPLTETSDDFPLMLLPTPMYEGVNVGTYNPRKKTSVSSIVRMFVGNDTWFNTLVGGGKRGPEFATVIDRAHTFRPVNNHPNDNQWKATVGTGFIGSRAANADGSEAAHAMMGAGELPAEALLPMTIVL